MKKEKRICIECGAEIYGTMAKKFCEECADRYLAKYLLEKRPEFAYKASIKENGYREKGKRFSQRVNNKKWLDVWGNKKNPRTMVQFQIPYKTGMSKNFYLGIQHHHDNGKFGFYKKTEARTQEELIISHLSPGIFKKNKVWVDIFVEKKDNRSDAVNVVDLVCDAIKKGIGVDDRWFCLGRLDWVIVKDREPQVFIKVYQEDSWDCRICSFCGRILPIKCFNTKKNATCKECTHKDYIFSDDDLEEMIKTVWIPNEFYINGDLSEDEEKKIQKCIVHQRIYGDAES